MKDSCSSWKLFLDFFVQIIIHPSVFCTNYNFYKAKIQIIICTIFFIQIIICMKRQLVHNIYKCPEFIIYNYIHHEHYRCKYANQIYESIFWWENIEYSWNYEFIKWIDFKDRREVVHKCSLIFLIILILQICLANVDNKYTFGEVTTASAGKRQDGFLFDMTLCEACCKGEHCNVNTTCPQMAQGTKHAYQVHIYGKHDMVCALMRALLHTYNEYIYILVLNCSPLHSNNYFFQVNMNIIVNRLP